MAVKKSKICPKCSSSDVIYIEPERLRTQYQMIQTGFASVSPIEVYVCGNCGYTEKYIANLEDIAKIKKVYQDQQ